LALFDELSSIALAHLSQYFSTIIAPSVLYLTNFVAGSPHPIQNLEFFSAFEVNGSILFSFFSNNHIFSNYIERMYNKLDKTITINKELLLRWMTLIHFESGRVFFRHCNDTLLLSPCSTMVLNRANLNGK
jgi:hypothetical protein